MRKLLFPTMIIAALSGCVQQKPVEWSAVGGSRADATVKLQYSFKYGTPNPDINQAIHLAKSRCASWGYASAELFGGETKDCTGTTEPGLLGVIVCNGEWVVTKEFQCTGEGNASKTSVKAEDSSEPEEEEEEVIAPKKKEKA